MRRSEANVSPRFAGCPRSPKWSNKMARASGPPVRSSAWNDSRRPETFSTHREIHPTVGSVFMGCMDYASQVPQGVGENSRVRHSRTSRIRHRSRPQRKSPRARKSGCKTFIPSHRMRHYSQSILRTTIAVQQFSGYRVHGDVVHELLVQSQLLEAGHGTVAAASFE